MYSCDFVVVAGDDGDVAAIDHPEESQEIDVVLEHIGKILRRGLADPGSALRRAGTHDLALIPGNADEADLGAHGADGVAVRWAIGRAQEGGDALRLEGAVVQLRRIDVIVRPHMLMGTAMLMRHVLPEICCVAHFGFSTMGSALPGSGMVPGLARAAS